MKDTISIMCGTYIGDGKMCQDGTSCIHCQQEENRIIKYITDLEELIESGLENKTTKIKARKEYMKLNPSYPPEDNPLLNDDIGQPFEERET